MEFIQTDIPEVWLVTSIPHEDDRGTFVRVFSEEFSDGPFEFCLEQVNVSKTHKLGSIRGMHLQTPPYQEKKIVRCRSGSVFDVAIDMRPASPTYLSYVCQELSALNNFALVIPEGFAHGFQTLENDSIVHYTTSQKYSQEHELGIRYDDPDIGIDWPLEVTLVSEKDRNWPLLGARS